MWYTTPGSFCSSILSQMGRTFLKENPKKLTTIVNQNIFFNFQHMRPTFKGKKLGKILSDKVVVFNVSQTVDLYGSSCSVWYTCTAPHVVYGTLVRHLM